MFTPSVKSLTPPEASLLRASETAGFLSCLTGAHDAAWSLEQRHLDLRLLAQRG
jgi:hypothetical protein